MDLEHTTIKRNKCYFPVLLLALAQAKRYKTASDVTVLYIVPAETNHLLEENREENREESGPLLIGHPKDPYLSEKVLQIHDSDLYSVSSLSVQHVTGTWFPGATIKQFICPDNRREQ